MDDSTPTTQVDVAIVGAGPIGLCFANALSRRGVSSVLIDRQPRSAMADPGNDGREIALTRASQQILDRLDVWSRIDHDERALMCAAKVFDGQSLFTMEIAPGATRDDPLGCLVPNQVIRRAAYAALQSGAPGTGDILWRDEQEIARFRVSDAAVDIQLGSGERIQVSLLVAADSRFSTTRRAMGIPAHIYQHGQQMLVCRMHHDEPHDQTAWEWFGYGHTLALLPVDTHCSSLVLTLSPAAMEKQLSLSDEAFDADITRRFEGRLGAMRRVAEPHCYPLVSVYAERFVGHRQALVGDAAVGMHPVTAHGFNLGLQGLSGLAERIGQAHARGQDIASPELLSRYQREQRLATAPLFAATLAIVGLYTDDRTPARWLRKAVLRAGEAAWPARRLIASHLMRSGG
ncbi:5-demethoxyubiquinol-8 5-hydroxylase UbiM [Salinicola corii]|uniref:5-demethoxyubiquinol-8 5-hydroxylase UbiM n=1 Tax=Salinicola corii TaxID=2606937 RepID=A0A640WE73_9GAMM|nr:5-demethoxyubiquinol-8 5-hydroxylase UbiM [Salinicola corii]KAA0018292.1 5-demethoxyubiquinol-8 5-hydroxylase UbiM [Salinicola corii]